MIRRTLGASLLAALFLATPALSEEATIGRPIEGGSLHEGRLDMVVYYVPVDGDLLEVTATFAPKGAGDPLRVVMGLADRDSVAFSMPGYQDFTLRVLEVRRGGDGLVRNRHASASRCANALTRRADHSLPAGGRGARVRRLPLCEVMRIKKRSSCGVSRGADLRPRRDDT